MEIAKGRWSVAARFQVQGLHRGAAGAEVDPVAADIEVMMCLPAEEAKPLAGTGNNVFHQLPGEAQPAQVVYAGAAFERPLHQHLGRLTHTQFIEYAQRRAMDALAVALRKWPVLPADWAWWAGIESRRRIPLRAHHLTRADAAATANAPGLRAHDVFAGERIREFCGSYRQGGVTTAA